MAGDGAGKRRKQVNAKGIQARVGFGVHFVH
jgi:hypothetical protein